MQGEPGYQPVASVGPVRPASRASGSNSTTNTRLAIEQETRRSRWNCGSMPATVSIRMTQSRAIAPSSYFREVFRNPGLYIATWWHPHRPDRVRLQGLKVVHDNDKVFVVAFQGVLCLFLLEMGMTAARRLKDLKGAGPGFIAFGLLAPQRIRHYRAHRRPRLRSLHPMLISSTGTTILFAVLCGAASYIALPAVQRLAIPEASPTLPLAASLGLTFSYNVTIGIPVYIEIFARPHALVPNLTR